MKGFIPKSLAALCMGGGLAASGCWPTYNELVDPCYPERYNYAARQEVYEAFAPQVMNGHVLDQTVWSYHFERGSDQLTHGGMEHLAYIARRRPCPDPRVYLQTAQDVPFDVAAPDKFVEARSALDRKRIQAIERFLTAQTAGRPMTFDVSLHDPSEVGMPAKAAATSMRKNYTGYQGNLPLTGGAPGIVGGGLAAPGGGQGGNGGMAPPGGGGGPQNGG
jgi:hypothetical protein